eukprot:10254951-Prorocentrum_lima.AAC.1
MTSSLVGSEMCIRDRSMSESGPGMSSSPSSKGIVGSGMETKEGSWRGANRWRPPGGVEASPG